ncbi:hypothetical protein C8C77_13634 [Halanaerobium saccharolyticum]|uniref:Uncharacterized protein n=1 Tax=Halanaerobium saccharolyticum TaxID=43595 RepID=A0A4R7YL95_9FIRM|nr:hypothetical protein [Halanaerobium saccharolyticum]RAK05002.1 hypothetical protein C7958_13234 [Halanaerobium saccharolyticum]TDV98356.1 hypothetical protein C8C77_13634 [Halanaerobium saccharolyticum]TDX51354.1 hypothetical protein C7956_13534 [Halanaerobium saccharolyticum]
MNDKNRGIPTEIQEKIDGLKMKYPNISIGIWGVNTILGKLDNLSSEINSYDDQDKKLFINILKKMKPNWVEYFCNNYNVDSVLKRGAKPIFDFLRFMGLPDSKFKCFELESLRKELVDSIAILTDFFSPGNHREYYFIERGRSNYFLDARNKYWRFVKLGEEIFNINIDTLDELEYFPDF